ncbi:Frigida-like [Vigna unguiculata]|uniref:FRIGIDA-like protein n=1 Tax=Vigna unguiculata TaxID=3917 RepID=A0A4D6KNX0_VIGUN|nr:Frigida-like [Vigna unguiculata]
MDTLNTISTALNLVDSKKENLKKAFDDLQSLLSPLPLAWPDLDSHFTSLHHSLSHRLHLLQSQTLTLTTTPIPDPPAQTPIEAHFSSNPKIPSSNHVESSPGVSPQNDAVPGSVTPGNELVVLCEKMDGVGLRNYVNDNFLDMARVQAELPGAFRHAPDAGMMVLDALEGFHGDGNGLKKWELRNMRKSCVVLLRQFRVAALSLSAEASLRAVKLAQAWKEKLVGDDNNVFEALGLLHLIASFGLVSEFSWDELVDFSVVAPANEDFPELCRAIGLTEKVPDIVQKLIDKDKHIPAVKYILEFNLADQIPPVPVLEAAVDEAKKLARKLSEEGNSSSESTAREIHTLKLVIKIIENYKLESEHLRATVEQRIEQLKRQKTNNKRSTAAPASKPQHKQQQQQQKRNMQKQQQPRIKHPRASAPIVPAAVLKNVNSAMHHYQQPRVHPSGLFPEHPNPYRSSSAMPFGMMASTPKFLPYAGPSAGSYYGHDGVPMGPRGNPNVSGSHLSSSEPHVPTGGYYDRTSTFGGIGLQHHYQASYYPQ